MGHQVEHESWEQPDRSTEFAWRQGPEEGAGPGADLLRFAGSIPPGDLGAIAKAIEEDCEQTHPDEW